MSCVTGLCVATNRSYNSDKVLRVDRPEWGCLCVDIAGDRWHRIHQWRVVPGSGMCVLADSGSTVVTSTEPTGATSAWTVTELEVGSNALQGVSCVSEELCVAVDDAGNVLTSTDPTAEPGTWTSVRVDSSGGLDDVSCPSTGLCVAVDGAGDIVTSTEPAGGAGAWHIADVDGTRAFLGVSCASVRLWVAIDSAGDISYLDRPDRRHGGVELRAIVPGLDGGVLPVRTPVCPDGRRVHSHVNRTGGRRSHLEPEVCGSQRTDLLSLGEPVPHGQQRACPARHRGRPHERRVPVAGSGGQGSQRPRCDLVRTDRVVCRHERGWRQRLAGERGRLLRPGWWSAGVDRTNVYGVPLEPPNLAFSLGGVEMPAVSCVPEGCASSSIPTAG